MIKNSILGFLAVLSGIAAGVLTFFLLAVNEIRFDEPVLKVFGIRKPEIVGFLPYWLLGSADRNYDPYITTLTYFGLVVDSDGKPVYLTTPQEEEPGWTALKGESLAARVTDARQKNHKLSLLVHGANEEKIAELINDPREKARALMNEVAPIMEKQGFTDLNLDIESFLPASPSARANFTEFVSAVANEIDTRDLGTLTVEIAPIALFRDFLIDPKAIGELADTVVLMAYDYHYRGSFVSGAVAPVGGGGETIEFDVAMSIEEALKVIPNDKLILGIPLYGYDWETVGDRPGAPTIPGGASTATAKRVAQFLKDCATCSAELDQMSREPYIIYKEDTNFAGTYYENVASLREKLDLARRYELGGVALWALGYEDDTILRPLAEYKGYYRFEPVLPGFDSLTAINKSASPGINLFKSD